MTSNEEPTGVSSWHRWLSWVVPGLVCLLVLALLLAMFLPTASHSGPSRFPRGDYAMIVLSDALRQYVSDHGDLPHGGKLARLLQPYWDDSQRSVRRTGRLRPMPDTATLEEVSVLTFYANLPRSEVESRGIKFVALWAHPILPGSGELKYSFGWFVGVGRDLEVLKSYVGIGLEGIQVGEDNQLPDR